jgi:Type IV secretion system pilin
MIISNIIAAACGGGDLLSLPKWYEFLNCGVNGSPELTKLNDIWAVLAAVVDILLRVSALLAVGMIIYGGATYMSSQGNSERTNRAKGTIISAAVGLLICSIAIATVHFIGGIFS